MIDDEYAYQETGFVDQKGHLRKKLIVDNSIRVGESIPLIFPQSDLIHYGGRNGGPTLGVCLRRQHLKNQHKTMIDQKLIKDCHIQPRN